MHCTPRTVFAVLLVMLAVLAGPSAALNILLIDDGPEPGCRQVKDPTERNWDAAFPRSALIFEQDLTQLGHAVTVQTASTTVAEDWPAADLLVWASGDHPHPLADPAWRASLRHFVMDGGRLLIEGGEIAFLWHEGASLFSQQVLHIDGWSGDAGGDLELIETGHPLALEPNLLPGTLPVDYQGLGDADRVGAAAEALSFYEWTTDPGRAGLVAYDPNVAPEAGQIIFMPLRYGALDEGARRDLLENGVAWLGTPEWGTGGIAGNATLSGEEDHSGIMIQVQPGGMSTFTTPDGSFGLPGLFPGQYSVTASREGFGDDHVTVEIDEGEIVGDLAFFLDPVLRETWCELPGLAIPDHYPGGIVDTILVDATGVINSVELFVDISHSWIGDLIIYLRSPDGTRVLVHNRTGGPLNEIYGWYPDELDSAQDLDLYIGKQLEGIWRLQVTDMASSDLGVLDEWCLRLTWSEGTDAPGVAPALLRLDTVWPNPFNPRTTVRFNLEREAWTELGIFDARGRRVRRLWSNTLAAGEHQMDWDGRDDGGRSMPSGLYFLCLEAVGERRTGKLVMLQ